MNAEEMIDNTDELTASLLATVSVWLDSTDMSTTNKKCIAVTALTSALFTQANAFGIQPPELTRSFLAMMQVHISYDNTKIIH